MIIHSLNVDGRHHIKKILDKIFNVYLGVEDFLQPEIWKLETKIVLQAIGIEKVDS